VLGAPAPTLFTVGLLAHREAAIEKVRFVAFDHAFDALDAHQVDTVSNNPHGVEG
jgi:hypothetical protein